MNEDKKVGVIIVEDDEDFIFLIKESLRGDPDILLLGCAKDKDYAVTLAAATRPDIVLMDLSLKGSNLDGIDAAREIRLRTDAKVIILSSHEQEQTVIQASTACFASNYIFKSNYTSINHIIKETARGRSVSEFFIYNQITGRLSDAERAIFLTLLGEDMVLKSSPKTIANQKTEVFRKLGVKNQRELVHIFKKPADTNS